MSDRIENILQGYSQKIKELFKSSLVQIILYGSYARGDSNQNSDIDIMILTSLTDGEIIQYEDILSDITYDFNWENNVEIMPIIKNVEHFDYWKEAYMFYKNVEKEGVIIA